MKDITEIIKKLADGEIDMMAAFALAYNVSGCADIGVAQIDHNRKQRCGFPEFIYGAGKTPEQICSIIPEILNSGHPVLATRVSKDAATVIIRKFPQARQAEHPCSRYIVYQQHFLKHAVLPYLLTVYQTPEYGNRR